MTDDERALAGRAAAVPAVSVSGVIEAPGELPPAGSEVFDDEPADFEVDELTPLEVLVDGVAPGPIRRAIEFLHKRTVALRQALQAVRRAANTVLAAEAKRSSREQAALKIGRWALGLAVPALFAGVGALYAAGVRRGLEEAAAAERARDRQRIEALEQRVQRNELNLSNLRGLLRAPWAPPAPGSDETP